SLEHRGQSLRSTLDLLRHELPAIFVNDADLRGFHRQVQSGIMLHGCFLPSFRIRQPEVCASTKVRGKQPQLHDDSLEPPCDEGGDGDGGHEGLDMAVEACGYAPPVLEAAEHALDDVALSVNLAVVFDMDLTVGLCRDDWRGTAL